MPIHIGERSRDPKQTYVLWTDPDLPEPSYSVMDMARYTGKSGAWIRHLCREKGYGHRVNGVHRFTLGEALDLKVAIDGHTKGKPGPKKAEPDAEVDISQVVL